MSWCWAHLVQKLSWRICQTWEGGIRETDPEFEQRSRCQGQRRDIEEHKKYSKYVLIYRPFQKHWQKSWRKTPIPMTNCYHTTQKQENTKFYQLSTNCCYLSRKTRDNLQLSLKVLLMTTILILLLRSIGFSVGSILCTMGRMVPLRLNGMAVRGLEILLLRNRIRLCSTLLGRRFLPPMVLCRSVKTKILICSNRVPKHLT